MRFRCSGNACPIRGPGCIGSGISCGGLAVPGLQIAVWIRTKRINQQQQVPFVPAHIAEHRRYISLTPAILLQQHTIRYPPLEAQRHPTSCCCCLSSSSYMPRTYSVLRTTRSPSSPHLNKGHDMLQTINLRPPCSSWANCSTSHSILELSPAKSIAWPHETRASMGAILHTDDAQFILSTPITRQPAQ